MGCKGFGGGGGIGGGLRVMEEKEDSRDGEKAGGGRGAKGGFSGAGGGVGTESCFLISACDANASLSVVLLVMKLDALRLNSSLSCANSP
jgi:hypothetical protein